MPKRFTATELWSEDWFLEMPFEYKLFWYYMLSKCDHAGLFKPNMKTFCMLNNVKITPNEVIEFFNNGKDRIRVISDSVWLIEDFFVYQYGTTFNINNRVHESINAQYKKFGVNLSSIRGLIVVILDLKERPKDKDINKEKELGINLSNNNAEKQKVTFRQVKEVYANADYESQSDEIKSKFSKDVFESYLNFLKLFNGKEAKIKFHDFPLLGDYFEDLYKKFTFEQISKGVTTMFGYQIATEAHLISRIITCIGFGVGNSTFKAKTEDINSMNDLSDYDKAKTKMGGNQSFRKKESNGANN